jgi:hypothetical protein
VPQPVRQSASSLACQPSINHNNPLLVCKLIPCRR